MSARVPAALRRLVRQRAGGRCEYCLLHEEYTLFPHQVDHVVARKHGGATLERNLVWACFAYNKFKGSDLSSIDFETGRLVRLFNPRKDQWSAHFRLRGGRIIPVTATGRVTADLLH